MSKRLTFALKTAGEAAVLGLWKRFQPNGQYMLNRTEWRGKEPRSCAVTRLSSPPQTIGSPMVANIEVTYRPKGDISYTGNTKYDGWTAMVLQRNHDGVLLDKDGQPLKDGERPVYLPQEVYQDGEFNDLDFGTFVEEVEIQDVKRTTIEAIFQEIQTSGKPYGSSIKSSFVAPHRSRPQAKIVLSNLPTQHATDGFGTRLLFLNSSTPNLEHALMDLVGKLMCDFIEGKVSIANVGNEDVLFVELSSSLIDCTGVADGLETWFDVLNYFTPIGFLDNLAKQIASLYEVEVEVIEGKSGGLVLRRERKE